jgi:putative NIF3 family GTP cyclohydrolase 1 type 2
MKPDGIMSGMAWKLNWEKYATNSELIEYKIPKTTLQGLVNELKMKFPGYVFQVVGKPEMEVTGVGYAAGASGSGMHLHLLNKSEIDVVIAGEGQQWETYEYTREAVAQGYNKAVIFLGHIPSEEAGMEYCATWLKSFIKNVPITFYTCGPSYKAM